MDYDTLFRVLRVLHFVGLAMGFAVSFGNMVVAGLIAKASAPDKAVLGRFSPAIVRVGDTGLALLWVTGLLLVFLKWGGFADLPWQFHVKVTAVVILTGVIGYIHALMRKARNGDAAAAARIPAAGKVAFLSALTALVFAVLSFA